MAKNVADFRQIFGQMAPQAIISRSELAALLCKTEGAISQMTYRGELPATAFPAKRCACWFVADIRDWLDKVANSRSNNSHQALPEKTAKTGRPRLSTDHCA
jgi:hypothetical protein